MRRHDDLSGTHRMVESTEIEASVDRVYTLWTHYEDLPSVMPTVRHVKRFGDRVLWDVEIGGRQIMWEARIVETIPAKRVRWESCRGTPHFGEALFEQVVSTRTRLTLDITYAPRGPLERLGALLGLVDARVRGELERFRRFAEVGPEMTL